jgi:hypothetical protein
VQRTGIFVAKIGNIMVEGAAHRTIKFNIAVRCTFKTWLSHHCYKYYGALHLYGYWVIYLLIKQH